MISEDGFTSFLCPSCKTEIEASLDMIGQATECPACGTKITVPKDEDDDGVVRHAQGDSSSKLDQARKSRTIRIELGDM